MRRVRETLEETRKSVPKAKEALEREPRAVRREAKMQVRTIASTQLANLTERLGPEHRRREKDAATIAGLRKRLRRRSSPSPRSRRSTGVDVEANRRG